MAAHDIDVVIFGATGDTGVVGCSCLYFRGKQLGISSWAPAARNLAKLDADVLSKLKAQAVGEEGLAPSESIQADLADPESLKKMASRAKCVLTCAGPYSQYGEAIVKACVESGAHYVDITGEVDWVIEMETKYGEEAKRKGVTLVSLAGYDSVPADMGTYLAAKCLEKGGQKLQRFEAFIGAEGGVMPTGTINTALGELDSFKGGVLHKCTFGLLGTAPRPAVAATPSESSWLPPAEESRALSNLLWTMLPSYSWLAKSWTVPHFMAPVNVFTVHHTAVREGYGGLEYREQMAGLPTGLLSLYGFIPASICYGALAALVAMAPLPGFSKMVRKAMDCFNTGLQKQARDLALNGFSSTGKTTMRGYAKGASGAQVTVKMSSNYDPGLGFTMLTSCAIAGEVARRFGSEMKPGFLSAVVALGGETVADTLRKAGIKVEVEPQ